MIDCVLSLICNVQSFAICFLYSIWYFETKLNCDITRKKLNLYFILRYILLVVIYTFSLLTFRRKNRQNKAKSPEVDSSLSYMVFDSRNKLSDNHLYATCQTVEEVELNITSKQNQETVQSQHTASNTMHRIGPDYDVPLSDKPLDRDTSSMCLYEVPYTNRMNHDSSPMPLYAVPNNSFIKRGPLPTLMNAAINVSIKSKPEK